MNRPIQSFKKKDQTSLIIQKEKQKIHQLDQTKTSPSILNQMFQWNDFDRLMSQTKILIDTLIVGLNRLPNYQMEDMQITSLKEKTRCISMEKEAIGQIVLGEVLKISTMMGESQFEIDQSLKMDMELLIQLKVKQEIVGSYQL